jgi:GTP-binding protein
VLRPGGDSSTAGDTIKVAIMGLPNVGKSTLVNQLLQQERCLTGPEPGLTRDAVHVKWEWQGRKLELVGSCAAQRPAPPGCRAPLRWPCSPGALLQGPGF